MPYRVLILAKERTGEFTFKSSGDREVNISSAQIIAFRYEVKRIKGESGIGTSIGTNRHYLFALNLIAIIGINKVEIFEYKCELGHLRIKLGIVNYYRSIPLLQIQNHAEDSRLAGEWVLTGDGGVYRAGIVSFSLNGLHDGDIRDIILNQTGYAEISHTVNA